jgi:hypothetical protein
MRLAASDLIPVNIDIPTAVALVVGKLAAIRRLRADIVEELPHFDVSSLDNLETYTLATAHAHALCLAASTPPEALAALTASGTTLRDTLCSDALALANRDLIDGAHLDDFRAAAGYKNLAFALLGLAALFRQSWDSIAGKTAVAASELDQAELIGEGLVNAVGARERARLLLAAVAERRQRVFTLFARAYHQVRRAVGYLSDNDTERDHIAPSLYGGRKRRSALARRAQVAVAAPVAPPGAPADPAVMGAATPALAVVSAGGGRTPGSEQPGQGEHETGHQQTNQGSLLGAKRPILAGEQALQAASIVAAEAGARWGPSRAP